MQIGVVFPQIETTAEVGFIRDYIQTAEGLGYDYVLAYDHVLGANRERAGGFQGPYDYTNPFHEPFTLFSYMAAITERIHFATGILILPQRQTALVAKQAAQLDILSRGRLRLGIGIGWNPVEYESLNESFKNRGKRSEEQIEVLRLLWTQPLVTFEGKYHTIPDAGINPLPVQRPIPIWFGGGDSDDVLGRMARLGDGWMIGTMSYEKTREAIDKAIHHLHNAGRDPKTFGWDICINLKIHDPATWGSVIQQWRDLGITHLSINTMNMGLSPQAHIDMIRTFKQTLG
jgi:probable F420-dependent oxidoreductase